MDGYYREKVKYTLEEIKALVNTQIPIPDGNIPLEYADKLQHDREVEYVRWERKYRRENKFAEDKDDPAIFHDHIFEFYGIFNHYYYYYSILLYKL